jgi:hypothetical protein
MELQKSVGELSSKVDRLIDDAKSQGDKLDKVRTKLAYVSGAAAVILAILMFMPPDWRGGLLTRLFGYQPPAQHQPPDGPAPARTP